MLTAGSKRSLTLAALLFAALAGLVYDRARDRSDCTTLDGVAERFQPVVAATALADWAPDWESQGDPATCGDESLARRFIVIGWDGADWDLLAPLIDAGVMPNFAKLMQGGTYGALNSILPTFSPVVWTTIATGRAPTEHGIHGFLDEDRNQLYSNSDRRIRAIWNLLTEAHKTSLVVGYHNTFPAEAIDGVLVSNYLTQDYFNDIYGHASPVVGEAGLGLVTPPEVLDEVLRLQTAVRESFMHQLTRFVEPAPGGTDLFLTREGLREAGTYWREGVRRGFVHDALHRDVALALYSKIDPVLMLVHFQGLDWAAHRFRYYEKSEEYTGIWPPEAIASYEERRSTYGKTLRAFYQWADENLGRILELRGPDTAVVLLSDHGFEVGDSASRPGEHHGAPPGIIVLNGPGIRRGHRLSCASVYDVMPTLVAALGLELSRELPGSILDDAICPAARAVLAPVKVDTYETTPWHAPGAALPAAADDELREQLEALGYLQ